MGNKKRAEVSSYINTNNQPLILPEAVDNHLLRETQQSEEQLQTVSLPQLADFVLLDKETKRNLSQVT